MDDVAESAPSRRTAADYDALPYPSFPYGYLHPGRLAALALLQGLAPAPVAGSRVLELGCASGGNLIPLAAQFPQARFLGVDLSARQVDDGRRRIARLGLTNIELRQADLAHARFDHGAFDTILCHGVFSWVPDSVQDAILRVCADSLSHDGLAAISFNVLPGWHLRSIVRDICLSHAGPDGTPQERAARARRGLLDTAAALKDTGPYAALLRAEAKRLADAPPAYLVGEFLAEHNTAFAFDTFAARVAAHGLSYLCEGSYATSLPEQLVPAAAQRIRALAGADPVAVQRQTDIVSGRQFRRALLVRSGRGQPQGTADDALPLAALRHLHFASPITRAGDATEPGAWTFSDARGRQFTLKDPGTAAAFMALAARYPSTASLPDLLRAAAAAQAPGRNPEPRLARALLRLLGSGRATVSTCALTTGRADDARPCVWPLAREEVACGQAWLTGQNHVGVAPPPLVRRLVPLLDGRHDRHQLLHFMNSVPGEFEDTGAAAQALEGALSYLARHALLLAQAVA